MLIALLIAVPAIGLMLVVMGSGNRVYRIAKDKVSIEKVVYADFQDAIPIQGSVEPLTTLFITAPEGGNVEEIFVEDGSLVKQGTPLLRLSNASLLLDYMNRETQIIEQINNLRNTRLSIEENKRANSDQLIDVEFQLRESERKFKMDSVLYHDAVISADEFYQSQNNTNYLREKAAFLRESMQYESQNRQVQLDRISRSIELMERNLEAIRKNLENLVIKAPISGQLTSFNPQLGTSKSRGELLGTIDVLEGYKVRAMVDEFYIHRIQLGQIGTFQMGGESFRLRVSRVIPEVSNGQFEVHLLFSDSLPASVTRGQTLQIKLAMSNTYQALLVPRGGFYQSTGGHWVFVTTDNERVVKRMIRTGRQNTDYIEVLDGLKVGEKILTNSYTGYEEAVELKLID